MRVLVVEDEAALAEGVRRGLEAEGFATDVARNGVDGLWMATEHPYDVIVLDILLPGMNGYKVCAELRAAGVLDADPDAHRQGRRARRGRGARHRRRRLRHEAVLLRRAGRAAAGADPARRAASARRCSRRATSRLDPAERRAWRGDVELSLTARELSLLEFLAAARRLGLSEDRHRSTTSGTASFDGDLNIVEVYIGHLREQDRPALRTHGDRDRPRRRLPIGGRRWLTGCAGSGSA